MRWFTRLSELIKAEPAYNDILIVKMITVTQSQKDDKWVYEYSKPNVCPAKFTIEDDFIYWTVNDQKDLSDSLIIKYDLFEKAKTTNTLGYSAYVADDSAGNKMIVYNIITACAVIRVEDEEPEFAVIAYDKKNDEKITLCETSNLDEARCVLKCFDIINNQPGVAQRKRLRTTDGGKFEKLIVTDKNTETLQIISQQNGDSK